MKYLIVAYPYVKQYGTIEVPDNVPEEDIDSYIKTYWEEIRFEEPDLDYVGAGFEKERIE